MESFFPPLGFLFSVEILGESTGSDHLEAGFLEVSGITTEMSTEEISEGGENRYVHKVPVRLSNDSTLVLKRGLVTTAGASFGKWCNEQLSQGLNAKIVTKDIIVHLLDAESKSPKMSWFFGGAYPIKWEISGLNAEESHYKVESISLAYASVSTIYPKEG
ncbi:phage tail protein [Haliscomenobacter sp.]|uniref:phage tail protein n=1 Tax=Haliscomenobacter sp. TaxID=2717303 RepID=UPI003BAAD46F